MAIGSGGGETTGPAAPSSSQPAAGGPGELVERQPLHPGGDIQDCFRCHLRPSPPPEEKVSFCIQCHPLEGSHSSAPTPAHPVRFEASVKECYLCHSPHHGPEATDHKASPGGASLCEACHLSKDGLKGDEKVGDSCAQCHNLGLPPDHPLAPEGGTESCQQCHKELLIYHAQ